MALGLLLALLLGWGVLAPLGHAPTAWAAGPYPAFWPLFPFGFLLALFLLVFALRGSAWEWGRRWSGAEQEPAARELLRARYARGEITREQFRQMARDLDEVG